MGYKFCNGDAAGYCAGFIYDERPLSVYENYSSFVVFELFSGDNPQFYGSYGFAPGIAMSNFLHVVLPWVPVFDGYLHRYEMGLRVNYKNIGIGISQVRVVPSAAAPSKKNYQAPVYLYFYRPILGGGS